MTVQEHQSSLRDIISMFDDRELSSAAQMADYYTECVKQGKLDQAEYASLLEDIGRQVEISQLVKSFETKQKLNTALHGLIAIARAV